MGAGDMDHSQLTHEIELRTGGLGASVHVSEHHTQPDVFEQVLTFTDHHVVKSCFIKHGDKNETFRHLIDKTSSDIYNVFD